MKNILLIFIFSLLVTFSFAQRNNTIEGKVASVEGETLPGVGILIKGTSVGTTTDSDGKFTLKADDNDVLVISFIGFATEEISVKGKTFLDVKLTSSLTTLEEVMVIGYGETKRITNTGAVSSVQAAEIRTVPNSNVQNSLVGRMPGFFAVQRSGQPGRDASDFFIRGVSSLNAAGNQPLIIVDDVQYSYEQLQQINVNEIESISILKDASTTAVYGIKGANGVLVVKTRRGKAGRPQVNVRVETGVQTPVRKPKFLDSYNSALLMNEAYENDGLQPRFTQADLDAFRTGNDPYGHPNVNWYDEIFKTHAWQHNANVDVSGGIDRLKYFISGGAFSQDGLVKDFSGPQSDVNTNYFYRRFNYRTNLDFAVTKTLDLRLDMTARFSNINEPRNQNAVSEIYNFQKIRPFSAPVLNPNGTYAYAFDTQDNLPTLNARLANGGYTRTRRTDSNILLDATQRLDFITPGLAVKGTFAYSGIEENSRQVTRGDAPGYGIPTYHYNSIDGSYSIDPRGNYDYSGYAVYGYTSIYSKNTNLQAFVTYDKVINDVHTLKVMALYNRQSTTVLAEPFNPDLKKVPFNYRGYTGRISYNYKNKYLVDFNGAYNGTDRFGKDKRNGFFPAIAAGWSLSEEDFFKNAIPYFTLFKLRASYGLVGSDVAFGNRYLFIQDYAAQVNGYAFGQIPQSVNTIREGDLGNPNVTWEKARKFDIGLDANLVGDKLSFTIDYFYDFRYDQLVNRGSIPSIIGIGTSPTNIAETSNQGIDGSVNYQTQVGQVNLTSSFVFSVAKNKVLYNDEARPAYPWLAATGRAINQPFGYTYIGFYSEEDIANNSDGDAANNVAAPRTSIPVQAGDLKYKDLNSDGVIDNFDQGPIGKPNLPNTTLGLNLGANYKGFSLSVLFQGSFNYSFSVVGTGIEPFKSQFQPAHLKRWTPDNADNAEFPRLTSNPTTVNSGSAYPSDFWLIDARFVRLKTVNLGYQLPDRLVPKNVNNVRLYLTAYNLLTWTNFSKYQQDPEISTNTAGDAYLNQRVVNVGVQVGF
jgi:TonB-linked SusC/RagA family outer membrane protein